MVVFSFPKPQTWAAKKATDYINKKYETNIEIEGIGIRFNGDIGVKGLFVRDHHQDTLVQAGEFTTSIINLSDIIKGDGELSDAGFKDLYVKMQFYEEDEFDNFRVFFKKFATGKKPKPFKLRVSNVIIENGRYLYISERIKPEPIVDIKNINLDASSLLIDGRDFSIRSNQTSLLYNDFINVTNLKTQMQLSEGVMNFEDTRLQTSENSDLKGDIKFTYEPNGMSDFDNKVNIKATISKSTIATSDIRLFYDEFGKKELFKITTKFDGILNDFKLSRLHVSGMQNSKIVGDLRLQNSRSKNLSRDFKISGVLKDLSSTRPDLIRLLPRILGSRLPKKLDNLGKVSIIGNVSATPKSIDLKGDVYSEIGKANTILFMDELITPKQATYRGNLIVTDFNLGKYTGNNDLGKASFNVDVNGKGFLLKNLDTDIEGVFSKLEYKGYAYSDIAVVGELKDPVFDGTIIANDPNLEMVFNGLVNINEEMNDYDFAANVKRIDFNQLNLFKRDSISVFSGNVIANLKGTNVDNAYGTISFRNTNYSNQNDNFKFKDFRISSEFDEENVRTININSPDIIEGNIVGKFRFKNLKNLFQNSLTSLYKKEDYIPIEGDESLNFDLKIYNKIVDVFFPKVSFAPNTFIRGNVSSDVSEFKLDFESPKIENNKNSIEDFTFEVDNANPLFTSYITVKKLNNKSYPITDFSLLNVSINDTLYVRSEFKAGKKSNDNYDLNFFHTSTEPKKSVVGVQKSHITMKGNKWNLNATDNKEHLIKFNHDFSKVEIDSMKIQYQNQIIEFGGKMRDSTYKDLKIRFSEVDLDKITPTIDSLSYKGIVNGDLNILQKDGAYYPESNISISDLVLNEIPLGDLIMNVVGNENLTQYNINSSLISKTEKPLGIDGSINVGGGQPTIDLTVDFNKFDLAPFSPLGGIVLSNLRGNVNGVARLTGSYKNPNITGQLKVNNGGMRFQYLNVDLAIEENSILSLTKQKIKFNNTLLTDTQYKTKAYLNGFISHKNFKDWNLDLKLDSDRLLVLNTDEEDNDLYYGTAFINGNAIIKGKTDQLLIKVAASSQPGTRFKIPLSDAEAVGDNSFIHFITPEEKQAKAKGEKIYFEDVKGLELEFDLDLNKYAQVEVVVDKESGSTLSGNGAGTLLIEINTGGKFNMWGDFVAYEGIYDFKYGGILSKRFDVVSGGSISWDGSPTSAQLDLSAVYRTNANPAILLENSTINRKIPVNVITNLQGELLKPDLTFDIEFPTTSSVVRSELDYLLTDRTTKERQALSLVTQGRFYSDALIGGNSIITENLVEHASSLVSSIFSSDDDKFDVGLDYQTGDRTTTATEISDRFGVSISTQISNRILINGKVGVPVGGVNESVVIGDVRIDFLLNQDGTLRATIFNRENDIRFIGEADGYTQGVGLSYSYDFDTFKQLLRKIFINEKKKQNAKIQAN